jgi:transposase-like protein
MYLNNVGIRKIALFLGVNPSTVLGWVRRRHAELAAMLEKSGPAHTEKTDVIEMDEIYTFVKKNKKEQSFGLLFLGGKSALLRLR